MIPLNKLFSGFDFTRLTIWTIYLLLGILVFLGGTLAEAVAVVAFIWACGEIRQLDRVVITQRRALRKISGMGFQSAKFSTPKELVEFSDELTYLAREALKETEVDNRGPT